MLRSPLTADRVRYVGEPFAVVVAESQSQATDAAELVYADYAPLDPLLDTAESALNERLLFPEAETNTVFAIPSGPQNGQDPFADCEVTVELAFCNPRMTAAPIEPRAAVASWDAGTQRLTYWACTQFPHQTRDTMSAFCGLEPSQVHVITPDVGGASAPRTPNTSKTSWWPALPAASNARCAGLRHARRPCSASRTLGQSPMPHASGAPATAT